MKRINKLLSVLITIAMLFAMSISVFAADPTTGTITVSHAEAGVVYSAYKILDADVVFGSEENSVAYYIDSTSPWYAKLSDAASPFTLTQRGTTTVYDVTRKDAVTDADIIAYIKSVGIPDGATAAKTATAATSGNLTTAVLDELPFGYYYVDSANGSVATITSATPTVTVVDKSQQPTLEKTVAKTSSSEYGETSTAAVGDTVFFKIESYAPKYSDQKKILEYKFTDTLATGLSYVSGSAELYVSGSKVTENFTATQTTGNPQEITFNYVLPDGYEASDLRITYQATVDGDAVYENDNTVEIDWKYVPYENPENPEETPASELTPTPTPEWTDDNTSTVTPPPDDSTDTYVYGIKLTKYADAVEDGNEIDGAQFELYKDDGTTLIPVVKISDGKYRVALTGETVADYITTKDGKAEIFGLDLGTYKLKETKAPDTYNIVEGMKEVVIAANEHTDGYVSVNIINKSGSILPTTGGVGTTIFFICGGILMLGAIVGFITKRRMDENKQETENS